METKPYLTVKETAEYLEESVYTIYNYCRDGKLEVYKPERRIYISMESIIRFIENGKVDPKSGKDK